MTLDDALYHTKCICSLADANEYPSAFVNVEALKMVIIELEKRMKRGKWIGNELGKCSVCGHEGCASDIWTGCKDGMFCPNCGADMREGDEE